MLMGNIVIEYFGINLDNFLWQNELSNNLKTNKIL